MLYTSITTEIFLKIASTYFQIRLFKNKIIKRRLIKIIKQLMNESIFDNDFDLNYPYNKIFLLNEYSVVEYEQCYSIRT